MSALRLPPPRGGKCLCLVGLLWWRGGSLLGCWRWACWRWGVGRGGEWRWGWWRVLTVTGLSNAEYLISSVALSVDEYYAGVGESPGVWAGRWAEGLGLSGVVEADQLRALVEGKHPTCGCRSFGRVSAPFGAGVRSDVLGSEERVVVVGAWFGAGGRGGGRGAPGGGGGGVGVFGGAGCAGPGAVAGGAPAGGHWGLGGGGVRASDEPGG